mmetsp:Transcript_2634/g.7258  ORF Transcript_2634/g.7258 Transcript_2634/m.7258 type:complete len:202 (-) Transcript_2634:649-1254(-)
MVILQCPLVVGSKFLSHPFKNFSSELDFLNRGCTLGSFIFHFRRCQILIAWCWTPRFHERHSVQFKAITIIVRGADHSAARVFKHEPLVFKRLLASSDQLYQLLQQFIGGQTFVRFGHFNWTDVYPILCRRKTMKSLQFFSHDQVNLYNPFGLFVSDVFGSFFVVLSPMVRPHSCDTSNSDVLGELNEFRRNLVKVLVKIQ